LNKPALPPTLLPLVLALLPLAVQASPFADAPQATLSHPQVHAARLQADSASKQESPVAAGHGADAVLSADVLRLGEGAFAPGPH
jgi:hypothetical protein